MSEPPGKVALPLSTLLFDLDGTLLDISMPSFLEGYVRLLSPRFGFGDDVRRFGEILFGSVRLMLHSRDGKRTLDRIFLEDFSPRVDMTEEAVLAAFGVFNREDMEDLRRLTKGLPAAGPLLEKALTLGYDLAVATNPVFFRETVEARLRWAGLEGFPFGFISTAENMHFCKPHPEYFSEIARHMRKRPGECAMIGNDPVKDMAASQAGLKTFFVPSPGERRRPGDVDRTGSLDDVSRWLGELGPIP